MGVKYITYLGMTKPLYKWAEYFCISAKLLYGRLARGKSFEEAIKSKKLHYTRQVTINGYTRSVGQWAKIVGVSNQTFWGRIARGWTDDQLLQPLARKKITAWGRTQSGDAWERETGIAKSTIFYRINIGGLSPEVAMTLPVDKRLSSKQSRVQKPCDTPPAISARMPAINS